jgi:hypothetical protein
LRRGRGRGMVKGWRLEFGKKGDRREGCVTATYGQLMSSRRKRKRERERERGRDRAHPRDIPSTSAKRRQRLDHLLLLL